MLLSRLIQGSFIGQRLRLSTRHYGTVQLAVRGPAFQLPPRLIDFPARAIGHRLPEAVQRKMEAFFRTDFSDIRIHVGEEASSIGALAFTSGSSVYFARNQYNPTSPHGQRLLGHELTHVLQQRAGRVRNPFGSGVVVIQDPGLEAEAERMSLLIPSAPMAGALQAKMAPQPSPRFRTHVSQIDRLARTTPVARFSTIQRADSEEKQIATKALGPYQYDTPAPFNEDTWDALKIMLGAEENQREKFLKLGAADSSYDCFNWSLGFRDKVEVPGDTQGEVVELYKRYGIEMAEQTTGCNLVIYADAGGRAIHVAVKIPVLYNSKNDSMWTSKLGGGLLITHPTPQSILKYYPDTQGFWPFIKKT